MSDKLGDKLGRPSPLNNIKGGLAKDLDPSKTGISNPGTKTPFLGGKRIFIRNSRYATVHTKTGSVIQAMPRVKWLYYATFNPSANIQRDFSSWQEGFAFQIHKIDRPKVTPELKTLNQYNRKRIVQTGIEFNDISLSFHDTVDDRVLRVWRDYYKWYFGEGRDKGAAWDTSTIENEFSLGNGWGFSPPDSMPWNTNFFESLDIYVFYGRRYTQHRVYNPKIASIDFESLESEATSLSSGTMNVKHEGVEYVAVGEPLTENLVELFNLNGGDYWDPLDQSGSSNVFLSSNNKGLDSAINSLLGNVSSNLPAVGQVLSNMGSRLVSGSSSAGLPIGGTNFLGNSSLGRWGSFF